MSESKYHTNTDMRIPPETLRDMFAGLALVGELASQTEEDCWPAASYSTLALRCYQAADAMIAARAESTQ